MYHSEAIENAFDDMDRLIKEKAFQTTHRARSISCSPKRSLIFYISNNHHTTSKNLAMIGFSTSHSMLIGFSPVDVMKSTKPKQ